MAIHVAVLSTDSRLDEMLRAAGITAVRPGRDNHSGAHAHPAAIVVDVRGQSQLPPALLTVRKDYPAASVILVASTLDPRLMLEAMRAGVNECVQEPLTAEALGHAIRRVVSGNQPAPTGQVFAFIGAKGGVGTTMLSVNTAAMLARASKSDVLFIDLHVGLGDSALFLGVEPRFSVIDALENVHRVDESFFGSVVEKTKVGIDLLGSSDRMIAGGIDPHRLRALVEFAATRYRYTVLDVPRSDVAMLDTLEVTSTVVVVTTQELPSLRSAGRLAHMLRTRYGAARVMAVMNRFDRRSEIAHADVERVIGDSVKHVIPSDYRMALQALNVGRPVSLETGALVDSLKKLAGDLGGIVKQKPPASSSVFGRLAFRRA
ncbi:MAG TPA: AAA family ATPase [Vicinamibacterales bacterium]